MTAINNAYIVSNLESSLASNQARIAKFAVEVQENPAHAMTWAMDTFSAAAEIKVQTEVINTLKDGCSLAAAIEHCNQRVLWGARNPARSTSVTSNLLEQEMVVAYAKTAEQLARYSNRYTT